MHCGSRETISYHTHWQVFLLCRFGVAALCLRCCQLFVSVPAWVDYWMTNRLQIGACSFHDALSFSSDHPQDVLGLHPAILNARNNPRLSFCIDHSFCTDSRSHHTEFARRSVNL